MADPTYTDWKDLHQPAGCSRCGALVAANMTDLHTQYHRDQDAVTQKVNEQGALLLKIGPLLGIKVG